LKVNCKTARFPGTPACRQGTRSNGLGHPADCISAKAEKVLSAFMKIGLKKNEKQAKNV